MAAESVEFHNAVSVVLDAFEIIRGNKLLRLRLERADLRDAVWKEAGVLADYARTDGSGHDFFHVYTGIQAVLTIFRRLQHDVVPVLRAELMHSGVSSANPDRFAIQVTLAGIDTNMARLLDALADLYRITRSRDLATHTATNAVFREFPALSQSSTWQVDSSPAESHFSDV